MQKWVLVPAEPLSFFSSISPHPPCSPVFSPVRLLIQFKHNIYSKIIKTQHLLMVRLTGVPREQLVSIKTIKIWFCYCCWVMSIAWKLCCCSCIWLDRSWKHASHCLVVGQLEPVCLSAATSSSIFLCSSSFLSNQYLLIFSSDNQLYQLCFFLPQLLLSIPTIRFIILPFFHYQPFFPLLVSSLLLLFPFPFLPFHFCDDPATQF